MSVLAEVYVEQKLLRAEMLKGGFCRMTVKSDDARGLRSRKE